MGRKGDGKDNLAAYLDTRPIYTYHYYQIIRKEVLPWR